MTDELIGMILSICGMIVTVLSFQLRSKSRLLIAQTVGSVFYLVSYVFSGGGIAIWLNVIYLVRNALFVFLGGRGMKMRLGLCIALCLSYLAAYALFVSLQSVKAAEALWNLLPVAGALFGTVATVCVNVNALRLWKIGDSCSGLIFNARIGLGALGGIIGEVLNLISIAVGLFRFEREKSGANRCAGKENDHE